MFVVSVTCHTEALVPSVINHIKRQASEFLVDALEKLPMGAEEETRRRVTVECQRFVLMSEYSYCVYCMIFTWWNHLFQTSGKEVNIIKILVLN